MAISDLSTPVFVCSVCACLDLSVSSSSWGLGKAAVCDYGTPWTFLLPFFHFQLCQPANITCVLRTTQVSLVREVIRIRITRLKKVT